MTTWVDDVPILAKRILDALEATHAVVKLPEPDEIVDTTEDENGYRAWRDWPGVTVFNDGEIHVVGVPTSVDGVRRAAAVLLAAAKCAEDQS